LDSPALYPSGIGCGSLNPQASSGAPPAKPRFENRECFLDETKGKNKIDLPTNPKWQIGLLLWLKALSRGLRLAAGGAGLKSVSLFSRSPSGDSKGCSPWRTFGDFPRVGKVTRGRRGGAPSPLRVWELCSHIGERRGAQPLALRQRPTSAGAKKL